MTARSLKSFQMPNVFQGRVGKWLPVKMTISDWGGTCSKPHQHSHIRPQKKNILVQTKMSLSDLFRASPEDVAVYITWLYTGQWIRHPNQLIRKNGRGSEHIALGHHCKGICLADS
jgi:hypothetical protein